MNFSEQTPPQPAICTACGAIESFRRDNGGALLCAICGSPPGAGIEATDETPEQRRDVPEIQTVHHIHRMGHEQFVRMTLEQRGHMQAMPTGTAEGVGVEARIDHGRWLTDCPFCPGAELVDLEDARFFCLSCYNRTVNGMWLTVVMPELDERIAIETAILERPEMFRHWRPGATVVDVQVENTLHEAW